MKKIASRCAYCRVALDENGVVANSDEGHGPDCADRQLRQSELKKLFAYRDRSTSATEWSPWTPVGEDLLTVLDSRHVRGEASDLLSELAALVQMSDANHSIPTDRERRSAGSGVPSFDPAAAERELEKASDRLRDEVEKLAGVTRNPHRSPEPDCSECQRRPRVVDSFCGPCAARILKEHRRVKQ